MLLKLFALCLWAMPAFTGIRKCPMECSCSLDELNRYQALCTRGSLISFPFSQLDPEVKVIIIRGSRNALVISPQLRQFLKLEVLRVTECNVATIRSESFWGLIHLQILDLSRNNIVSLNENNFRGQDNLHELDLSNNKILRMENSTFRHLTDLRRLNLAGNSIGELMQRNLFMLNKLKYLDLSGNPLQDLLPDVFRDVPELRILKCRNCQLKKINPQLYNLLPHLIELDLGRNEFKFLDKDEFRDVKRLVKVLLDGNQLSVVVDELFRSQQNLQHLDLSYNRLAKVPNDAFLTLTNLTFLDLSYNKLTRLEPQSVRRLINLKVLNISGNILMDLHDMRETFELIPKLTHLSIADMGVLPLGLLVPFRQLRYLNISGNHLDNMSLQVIDPCQELEFLDLSRNQLYGINEDTALRIQGIRNVRLDNNPLICDECHMGKLINIVRHLHWKWDTYPICFLPKNLRGAEITDLDVTGLDLCLEYITDEDQNAASTSHNFLEQGGLNTLPILGGIILVLIAIIILTLVACFSRNRARYYTREDCINGGEVKCLEKNLEISKATKSGGVKGGAAGNTVIGHSDGKKNEINFKFPVEDRVCTIDEFVLPPAATSLDPCKPSGRNAFSNKDPKNISSKVPPANCSSHICNHTAGTSNTTVTVTSVSTASAAVSMAASAAVAATSIAPFNTNTTTTIIRPGTSGRLTRTPTDAIVVVCALPVPDSATSTITISDGHSQNLMPSTKITSLAEPLVTVN